MDDEHQYDDPHAEYMAGEHESKTEREQFEAELMNEGEVRASEMEFKRDEMREDEDSIKAMCQHND